ncbi:replication initiator protein A [Enterococcus pallens]|uniref:Replication initiator A N-terminal domain-containing protein n=1 Tax=Enterococcus pallens ATCC BAA-351 TaxID=1158607 RepID=R2SDN1_9ENTE|nr:replication initiator protein A [Enterococcus pallens]EOH86264.1 hypothetical protein UAU_05285 [Enterococcus pallens ATCC BAA-351]EOU09412.1 hypothetical protein I588_05258 [Enterococcus pallens ATCC BAA-351]
MSEFKYFKLDRVYNELYYQFPKVLLVSETYKHLDSDAKIAYMLFKSRLEFAAKKKQVDEEGNVYFTFTLAEQQKMLQRGKQKVLNIHAQLEKANLLQKKSGGFNKAAGKKNPTRLYLAELEVTENDIYLVEEIDRTGDEQQENVDLPHGMKFIPREDEEKNAETLAAHDGMNFIPTSNVDLPHGMKNGQELYNNNLNNKDTKRLSKDEEKSLQDKLLLEDFAESMIAGNKTFLPSKVLTLLASFSHGEFETAANYMKAIHNAKANAEKLEDYHFMYEDVEEKYGIDIDNLIYFKTKKAIFKEKDEKIRNMDNLIFRYLTDLFQDIIRQIKATEEAPAAPEVEVSLHNWLEGD